MVLVESGLNSEQVSSLCPIYIDKMYFVTKTSGLNSEGGLNFEWSLSWNFTVVYIKVHNIKF